MAPATDWSGFYAGFQLGGASLEPNSSAATLIQPDSGGVVGGIHAGYNFQFDNFVLSSKFQNSLDFRLRLAVVARLTIGSAFALTTDVTSDH